MHWTDVVSAIAQILTLGVLAVAASIGIQQLEEFKDDRRARERPFVVIALDASRPPRWSLYVENLGVTMAKSVKFDFDPALSSTLDTAGYPLREVGFLSKPIASLPPRLRLETTFDYAPQRNVGDLEEVFEVTAMYEDTRGNRYKEQHVLDVTLMYGRLYTQKSDETVKGLKAIASAIDGLSS